MRAAVLAGAGSSPTIRDVDVDDPLPGEVLVRTAAAGVCHTDLSALEGDLPFPMPMIMGHEGAGVVEAVGPGVTSVRPGKRVVVTLSDFCGRCRYCIGGRPYLCRLLGRGRAPDQRPRITLDDQPVAPFCGVGSFAERIVVNANAVADVGDQIPLDRAALLGCGVLTGLGAALRTANVQVGDTVAVLGCGGVGMSVIQGARIAGAIHIIAIEPVAAKRGMAIQLGATDAVDPTEVDIVDYVLDVTRGGVDHAFEAAGRVATIEQAFAMLGRGGTATVVGAPGDVSIQLPVSALMIDRRIQGSWMGSNRFQLDVPAYVELYLQGRLLLDEMISARLPLEDLDVAFTALRHGAGTRNVVLFD